MSLLSDLNNKIKALSARVATECSSLWSGVNTAQETADAKVSKGGDVMSGDLAIQRKSPQMRLIDPTITKGTNLAAGETKYIELIFADSNELTANPSLTGESRVPTANIGIVGASVDETGLVRTYLRSYYFTADSDNVGEYTLGIMSDVANSTGTVYTTANKFQFGNGSQFWIA